jgi:hypothetical protein
LDQRRFLLRRSVRIDSIRILFTNKDLFFISTSYLRLMALSTRVYCRPNCGLVRSCWATTDVVDPQEAAAAGAAEQRIETAAAGAAEQRIEAAAAGAAEQNIEAAAAGVAEQNIEAAGAQSIEAAAAAAAEQSIEAAGAAEQNIEAAGAAEQSIEAAGAAEQNIEAAGAAEQNIEAAAAGVVGAAQTDGTEHHEEVDSLSNPPLIELQLQLPAAAYA